VKILFFGSGAFALVIAQEIHKQYTLTGVAITKPKPQGRGQKIVPPKIISWAQDNGISVFTPDDPNSQEFVQTLKKLEPDLYVLVSYGHILGSGILAIPHFGGINVHPSLLPRYRGAAPIQRALMAGETETGVSVIFMDEKIDHGNIVFQQKIAIEPDDTYGILLERLCTVSTDHITGIIGDIEHGRCDSTPQDHTKKSFAPKVKKEETVINWEKGTEVVRNLIRALSPRPAARTTFRDNELKILNVHKGSRAGAPGVVCFDAKNIAVGTGDGSLILDSVKPANKRFMTGHDFMNGYRIKEGEVMS